MVCGYRYLFPILYTLPLFSLFYLYDGFYDLLRFVILYDSFFLPFFLSGHEFQFLVFKKKLQAFALLLACLFFFLLSFVLTDFFPRLFLFPFCFFLLPDGVEMNGMGGCM